MLNDPDGVNVSLSFKLESCSNNITEYEALLLELISTLRFGVQRLHVQGDSELVIEQVNGEFALKKTVLVEHRTAIQKLIKYFSSIQFEHVPRAQNKYVDALATLASKADILEKETNIKAVKKMLRATTTELIPEVIIDKEDWRTTIIQKLIQPSSSIITRELKDFMLKNEELYYQGIGGILARAISKA